MIQENDIAKYVWDFYLTPEIGLLMHFDGGGSKTGLLVAFIINRLPIKKSFMRIL